MTKKSNPLFTEDEWDALMTHFELRGRQSQILWLIVSGDNDEDVAAQLGIASSTVRVHIGRLFQRLGVSDRTSLVIEVFRQFRELETKEQ